MKKYRIILRGGGSLLTMMKRESFLAVIVAVKADPQSHGVLSISTSGIDSDAVTFVRIEEVAAIEQVAE